jgi:serine/threonine protein phosphatase PrpC
VRKDNQDSGYAGEHLLVIADGVGGAARGDIASSTAVQILRRLDDTPSDDLLEALAGAIHRAHDRIAELVEEDPELEGTSTTVTVALFDGNRIGVGHVGDSRGYLLRDGELSQLTKDHTFVQSLIDEGRITEEESRTHPHRNLILRAVDGVHETEPDLFDVELAPGDRIMLCSDGCSGVLDSDRLADILGSGSIDYAVVELVRASLDAGSATTSPASSPTWSTRRRRRRRDTIAAASTSPMLVGAAAEGPARPASSRASSAATRSGDYQQWSRSRAAGGGRPRGGCATRPAPAAFAWLRRIGSCSSSPHAGASPRRPPTPGLGTSTTSPPTVDGRDLPRHPGRPAGVTLSPLLRDSEVTLAYRCRSTARSRSATASAPTTSPTRGKIVANIGERPGPVPDAVPGPPARPTAEGDPGPSGRCKTRPRPPPPAAGPRPGADRREPLAHARAPTASREPLMAGQPADGFTHRRRRGAELFDRPGLLVGVRRYAAVGSGSGRSRPHHRYGGGWPCSRRLPRRRRSDRAVRRPGAPAVVAA